MNAAPDWTGCTLELLCPRCGYNLRMLPTPRCPECGLDFEWARVIAAAERRVESPFFESQWRFKPLRSFAYTLAMTLAPLRLWRRLPLELPPRAAPLLLFVIGVLGLTLAPGMLAAAVEFGAWSWRGMMRWRGMMWLRWRAQHTVDEVLGEWLGLLTVLAVLWLCLRVYHFTWARYSIRPGLQARILILCAAPMVLWATLGRLVYALGDSAATTLWRSGAGSFASRLTAALAWAPMDLFTGVGVLTMLISLMTALRVHLAQENGRMAGLLAFLLCLTLLATGAVGALLVGWLDVWEFLSGRAADWFPALSHLFSVRR